MFKAVCLFDDCVLQLGADIQHSTLERQSGKKYGQTETTHMHFPTRNIVSTHVRVLQALPRKNTKNNRFSVQLNPHIQANPIQS